MLAVRLQCMHSACKAQWGRWVHGAQTQAQHLAYAAVQNSGHLHTCPGSITPFNLTPLTCEGPGIFSSTASGSRTKLLSSAWGSRACHTSAARSVEES
jgi:hypothetical protein